MSDSNQLAALDLGSNSFHLIVGIREADKLVFIDRLKDTVRLAQGLDKGGLKEEAKQKALESLRKFGQRLRGIPEDSVRVVGTNTLRAAKNSREFIDQAEEVLGFPIHVISGQEEARLIFKGVTHHFHENVDRMLVLDIGGGSTEMILGQNGVPEVLESLHMGCVSYTYRFFPKGKVTESAFERAFHAAQMELAPFRQHFGSDARDSVIGASGTMRAVERCAQFLTQRPGIDIDGVKALKRHLIKAGTPNKYNIDTLSERRAPVLAGGLAIVYALLETLKIKNLITSPYALREGLLLDLLGRHTNQDTREETIRQFQTRFNVDRNHAHFVAQFALRFFDEIGFKDVYKRRHLRWAALLHEAGLAISHSSYHKHGAYLIANAHMPGFDREEQEQMSGLVLNHRRKIRFEESPLADWDQILALRMAALMRRARRKKDFPPCRLKAKPKKILIQFQRDWLEGRPLTHEDLNHEKQFWTQIGWEFKIQMVDQLDY